jgi:hypothetical protein
MVAAAVLILSAGVFLLASTRNPVEANVAAVLDASVPLAATPTPAAPEKLRIIIRGGTRLRMMPSSSGGHLTQFRSKTVVFLDGPTKGHWIEVSTEDGQTGWVRTTDQFTPSTSAVVAPPVNVASAGHEQGFPLNGTGNRDTADRQFETVKLKPRRAPRKDDDLGF